LLATQVGTSGVSKSAPTRAGPRNGGHPFGEHPMSDPRRWLEADTGLTESERRALSAGLDMQPSKALEREMWAGLEARLAALAPGYEREAADAGGTPSHSLPS